MAQGSSSSKKGFFHRWRLVDIHEFVDYQIIYKINDKSKFNLPGAIVGGAIGGALGGALWGTQQVRYINKLIVRVTFRDSGDFDFKLLTPKTKQGTFVYRTAMKELEKISNFFAMARRDFP